MKEKEKLNMYKIASVEKLITNWQNSFVNKFGLR